MKILFVDNINNKIADGLIKYVIKNIELLSTKINQQILELNHTIEKLIRWLFKN
jgi:hypothetical protein